MLKQGVVQETLAELNTPGAVLPPLHNLPHWSRVNNFDKARYPKPFLKDRLQPLPNPSDIDGVVTMAAQPVDMETAVVMDVPVEPSRGVNASQRVVHLERSIHFLQQQHYEVLTHLHDEIDDLKRQNKELQFQIVMIQKDPVQSGTSHPASAQSRKHSSKHKRDNSGSHRLESASKETYHVPHPPPQHTDLTPQQSGTEEDLKVLFLEEEIKDLKLALREERNRNQYLQQLLDTAQKQASTNARHSGVVRVEHKSHSAKDAVNIPDTLSTQPVASAPNLEHPTPSERPRGAPARSAGQKEPLPLNATVNPLRVHTHEGSGRAPTVEESELIIKHLQKMNDNQAHELNQLKTDLRDVLYSHKWTPDAYLLAKAYVAEDDAREMAEQSRLPRIALKQSTRKLPEGAYLQKDAVSLPALKHTLGNKAVERRKRAQILQKSRYSNNKEITN